ncbi:MAG: ABC-F family ATP-binding cassette domain-containing protein [Kiritimatiellae bacterium]|nr:ABC-F family ATP-binding cassette domain-containing protein [Kiritimatiellia bacterium]
MLDFQNISVHYGLQDVLTNVSFRVNKGERVGVVGPNGSGKSTLFKIILGELSTDHGELVIEENPTIGSTRQHPEPDTPEETLLEYAMRGVPGFCELEAKMKALEARLDAGETSVLKEYGEVQTAFEHLGGYDLETRVKVALGGLGFAVDEFEKPFASFSGGWRMRAELSRVLASEPDLLLLDEPSNYLDLPAVDWLQRYLKLYRGTLMLISHDRYLLKTLTSIIVEVDAGTCTRYEGDLDWYLREREVRYQHLVAAKENQDHHREQLQRFVDRFRAQATKAAQAQSRQKLIDKIDEERIVLPKRYSRRGRLRLAEPPPSGIEMFRCENMFFSYDGVKNVLHDVTFNVARGDKVAVIGYNGLGKTTLMRIIAGTRQPTAGKAVLGHNVVCGYLSQEFAETIPPDLTVYRNAKNAIPPGMNEKNFRNQLGAFGFDENDVEKPAGVLSGGEKIRLAFLRLFLQCPNFLLLDEPTTHLDLDGRALLQDALQKYKGTILLVSHDIEFVRAVATSVIEITREEVRSYPGGYDYYCEKKAQREREATGASLPRTGSPRGSGTLAAPNRGSGTLAASPTEDQSPQKLTSKELRQQRAAERAKIAPRVKELKKRVETAERKLDELQKALDVASEELFNPKPTTDFAEVNRQVRTIQFEIDRYTADWESAATELEQLTHASADVV